MRISASHKKPALRGRTKICGTTRLSNKAGCGSSASAITMATPVRWLRQDHAGSRSASSFQVRPRRGSVSSRGSPVAGVSQNLNICF